MLEPLHVAVLMGGWSAERDVSLVTGNDVADALESRGHRVTRIDMDRNVAATLADLSPDVVFNALPRPYVLKPVNEGSSVGVAIIREGGNYGEPIAPGTAGPWQEFDNLLAEPFIPGRELTVAVLDDEALAVTELRPKSGFYDYDA